MGGSSTQTTAQHSQSCAFLTMQPRVAISKATVARSPAIGARPIVMSATHGLSKNDKKHLRKFNEKLFEKGGSDHLTHHDIENPSLRHSIDESPLGHHFSKFQKNRIIKMGQQHQYKQVERLAEKYGASQDDALHLAEVARAEADLAKHQRKEHFIAEQKRMKDASRAVLKDAQEELSAGGRKWGWGF